MTLFLTMLPIYLFGNLHCLGMCGPLAMMIGQHRYRYFYFLGRTLSFSFAGLAAGGMGAVLDLALNEYHIPAVASFLFGGILVIIGLYTLLGWQYPGSRQLSKRLAKTNNRLALLILRDQPWPTFLFGFLTIALPCGQTLIVFSACALTGSPIEGLFNGLAFALITSPSLLLAMQASHLMQKAKRHYQTVIGMSAIVVGTLALCRGFADIGLISHWVINPNSASYYHIVIY